MRPTDRQIDRRRWRLRQGSKCLAHLAANTLYLPLKANYSKYLVHIAANTLHTLKQIPCKPCRKYIAHLAANALHTLQQIPCAHCSKYLAHLAANTLHTSQQIPCTPCSKYLAHLAPNLVANTLHRGYLLSITCIWVYLCILQIRFWNFCTF
jgi:phage FluMu protein Com